MADFIVFVGADDDTPAEVLAGFIGQRYEVGSIPYIQYLQNEPCQQVATSLSTIYGVPANEEAEIQGFDSTEGEDFSRILWKLWERRGICVVQRHTIWKMTATLDRPELCRAIQVPGYGDISVILEQEFHKYYLEVTPKGEDSGPPGNAREARIQDPAPDKNQVVAALSHQEIVRGVTFNSAFDQKVTGSVETFQRKARERIENLNQTALQHLKSTQEVLSQRSEAHVSELRRTLGQVEELTTALQRSKTATSELDGNPLSQCSTDIDNLSARLQGIQKQLEEKSSEFKQLRDSKPPSLPLFIKDVKPDFGIMKFLVVNMKSYSIAPAWFWLEIAGSAPFAVEIGGGVRPGLQVLPLTFQDEWGNSAKVSIYRSGDEANPPVLVSNEFPWDFAEEAPPEKEAFSSVRNPNMIGQPGSQLGSGVNAPPFLQKGDMQASIAVGFGQGAGNGYGNQFSMPASQQRNPGPSEFPQQFQGGAGGFNAPAFLVGNREGGESTLPTNYGRVGDRQDGQPYQEQYSNPPDQGYGGADSQYQCQDAEGTYPDPSGSVSGNAGFNPAEGSNLDPSAGYSDPSGSVPGNAGFVPVLPELLAFERSQSSHGRADGLSPNESIIFSNIKNKYPGIQDDYLINVIKWFKSLGTLTYEAVDQYINSQPSS